MAKMKNGLKQTKANSTGPTAAERLQALESGISALQQGINILAEEIDRMNQANLTLAKRLDAMIKTSSETGTVNEEKINDFMIDQRVKELKSQVDLLVTQGVLAVAEKIENERYFIVGKEIKDGTVTSKRTQLAVNTLNEEVRNKFIGASVGDMVKVSDDLPEFMLDEVYKLQEPEKATETQG